MAVGTSAGIGHAQKGSRSQPVIPSGTRRVANALKIFITCVGDFPTTSKIVLELFLYLLHVAFDSRPIGLT